MSRYAERPSNRSNPHPLHRLNLCEHRCEMGKPVIPGRVLYTPDQEAAEGLQIGKVLFLLLLYLL